MYKKDTKKWLKHADFIIIDFICLQLSMVVAYFIRFGFGNPYADDVYRNVDIVAELISLFVIIYFETMQDIPRVCENTASSGFGFPVKHRISVHHSSG